MMGERNSKTKGSHWATKMLVCFIVLLFVINLGFAGTHSAQGSNENDNGDEDDKDPYSHVQLDPRVVNRAVDEIMDLLADDYSIDPLEEELRNTIEECIKGDYKEQLVEDIRAVNEALSLPTMTRTGENVAVNLLLVDSDYLEDRIKEVIGDKVESEEVLGSFENLKERSLSNILEGLPMAPSPGRHGHDLIEGSREGLPDLHDPTDRSLGDQFEDPAEHALSGGGRVTLREAARRTGVAAAKITLGTAAVCVLGPIGFIAGRVPVAQAMMEMNELYDEILEQFADIEEPEEEEREESEGVEPEGEVEEVEVAGASCECEGNCTCGDNGEQEDDKDTPAYCPITGPSYPDDDHDEDDVDWWRTPQPDPAGPEDDSGDEDNGIIAPPPGAEPDPIGPDYDDEDHGEFEIPPGQEPDPAGPGNGDFDLPGDEDFDFVPPY